MLIGDLRSFPLLRRLAAVFRFLTHPVVVFVGLQIVWVAIILLWVFWFIEQKNSGLVFLVIGCVLLGIILVGVVSLFVFVQRQSSLIRQQRSFVSSVTHELRSPLASLQLSFETLQNPSIPVEVGHRLHDIVSRDISRLSRLIDRILISARLDQGITATSCESEWVSFAEALEIAIDEVRYLDPEVRFRIRKEGDFSLALKLPKLNLVMVLNNLLENAMKYSTKDSTIYLDLRVKDNQYILCIRDEGYGINRKDLRKIFKIFHRAPIAAKKAIPGTGLGLFIVKTTVKSLGGKVWAESPGLGKGASFFVALPCS